MSRVEQIDHVELFVPDRLEAAAWYQKVLGLDIVEARRHWADDPHGPLMISSDKGSTMIALFTGEPQGQRPDIGFHVVAFRVDADRFAEFLGRLAEVPLRDRNGRIVAPRSVKDHGVARSIYFDDPYGNHLEVTTYTP